LHTNCLSAAIAVAFAILLASPGTAPAQGDSAGKDPAARVTCRSYILMGTMTRQQSSCRTEKSWSQSALDRRDEDAFDREAPLPLHAPSATQTIETGSADWARMAPVKAHGRLPYLQLVTTVRDMLRKRECVIPGQTAKKFDMDVRFAVLLDPIGKASRVVVAETGCQMLGTMVGLSVLARAERGDFETLGGTAPRWYAGEMNFTMR